MYLQSNIILMLFCGQRKYILSITLIIYLSCTLHTSHVYLGIALYAMYIAMYIHTYPNIYVTFINVLTYAYARTYTHIAAIQISAHLPKELFVCN